MAPPIVSVVPRPALFQYLTYIVETLHLPLRPRFQKTKTERNRTLAPIFLTCCSELSSNLCGARNERALKISRQPFYLNLSGYSNCFMAQDMKKLGQRSTINARKAPSFWSKHWSSVQFRECECKNPPNQKVSLHHHETLTLCLYCNRGLSFVQRYHYQ